MNGAAVPLGWKKINVVRFTIHGQKLRPCGDINHTNRKSPDSIIKMFIRSGSCWWFTSETAKLHRSETSRPLFSEPRELDAACSVADATQVVPSHIAISLTRQTLALFDRWKCRWMLHYF
jgi:hypothetical protein